MIFVNYINLFKDDDQKESKIKVLSSNNEFQTFEAKQEMFEIQFVEFL